MNRFLKFMILLLLAGSVAGGVVSACNKTNAQSPPPVANTGVFVCCDTAGTYFPAFGNPTVVYKAVAPAHFMKVNNEVYVNGQVDITGPILLPGSYFGFQISLPIPSNFTNFLDGSGTGTFLQVVPPFGSVLLEADTFADKMQCFFYPQVDHFARVFYTFSYTVK